jgi:hypothetical protein
MVFSHEIFRLKFLCIYRTPFRVELLNKTRKAAVVSSVSVLGWRSSYVQQGAFVQQQLTSLWELGWLIVRAQIMHRADTCLHGQEKVWVLPEVIVGHYCYLRVRKVKLSLGLTKHDTMRCLAQWRYISTHYLASVQAEDWSCTPLPIWNLMVRNTWWAQSRYECSPFRQTFCPVRY